MGDRCPMSEHAKRQESVDLRHRQCSLKSVESAGHRKVRSIIEERGKSEESSQPMLHSSSSAIELYGAALGLAVRQLHTHVRTLHCRNNQSAIRALRSAIKTAAATGCASKPADQTKSSQIKRSKTSRAYPKYVDALELTYLRMTCMWQMGIRPSNPVALPLLTALSLSLSLFISIFISLSLSLYLSLSLSLSVCLSLTKWSQVHLTHIKAIAFATALMSGSFCSDGLFQ